MKMVVIIPAYNEEASIGKMIESIKKIYNGNPLIVDDGSIDKTYDIAKSMGSLVVRHPYNMGLGAATRTGLARAYELGADIIVKIDADCQHEAEDIEKVIRPILDDKADCVFGSRFMGGLQYTMPLYRRWGNKFFSWLVSCIVGHKITDGQTGLMAFHRRYISNFRMLSDYNETQQLMIDSFYKHMRVIEVPVTFHSRKTGKSFISPKYPLKVLPIMIRMFLSKWNIFS